MYARLHSPLLTHRRNTIRKSHTKPSMFICMIASYFQLHFCRVFISQDFDLVNTWSMIHDCQCWIHNPGDIITFLTVYIVCNKRQSHKHTSTYFLGLNAFISALEALMLCSVLATIGRALFPCKISKTRAFKGEISVIKSRKLENN